MGIKNRFIASMVILWVAGMVFLLYMGTGVFVTQLSAKPVYYLDLQASDVQPNRAVYGDCYVIYGCVAEGYSEDEDTKKQTTNEYYWLVDCDDKNTLMLVKTKARDDISSQIDEMVEAYYDAETLEEYYDQYPLGVPLDGVFEKNDPEVVNYYNEFVAEIQSYGAWKDVTLAPCTLDCTHSYGSRMAMFYGGAAMLVLTIVGVIAFISFYKKKSSYTPAPVPAGVDYGNLTGGSYSTPDSVTTGSTQPQNLGYAQQNGFQAQNTGYTQQNGFQTQNTGYAQQSGFQAQNMGYTQQSGSRAQNTGYAQQSGFRAQNTGYAQQNGFQAQNTGGTQQGYYQPQSAGYTSQNPSSGINYGSTVGGSTLSLEKKDE